MFKKSLLIAVLVIAGATVYMNFFVKPKDAPDTVRVSYINLGTGSKLEHLGMIKEILDEKYKNIIIDHRHYDIIFDGPHGKKPIKNNDAVKIYFTGESVTPDVEKYDFSIGYDHISHPKYFRVPLYYMYFKDHLNEEFSRGECRPQEKPNFACFLYSNSGSRTPNGFDGCTARDIIFQKLSEYKKVHSGGKHLNNEGRIIPREETMEWLGKCKFVIAYENHIHDGFVTEKPFQAYIAGSLPIYYGTPNFTQDINPDSVIYANSFADDEALIEYIKKVDNDDELYCKIWNNKMLPGKENTYESVKNKLRVKLFEVFELVDKKKAEHAKKGLF